MHIKEDLQNHSQLFFSETPQLYFSARLLQAAAAGKGARKPWRRIFPVQRELLCFKAAQRSPTHSHISSVYLQLGLVRRVNRASSEGRDRGKRGVPAGGTIERLKCNLLSQIISVTMQCIRGHSWSVDNCYDGKNLKFRGPVCADIICLRIVQKQDLWSCRVVVGGKAAKWRQKVSQLGSDRQRIVTDKSM